MHRNNLLPTWQEFLKALLVRFGPSEYRDIQGELAKLTQTTSVADYQSRFEALANQTTGVPESFLQSCFESGLRNDIRREVRALQPHSLMQAVNLAKLMEDKLQDTGARSWPSRPVLVPTIKPSPVPPLLPTPKMTPNNALINVKSSSIPVKKTNSSRDDGT